MKLCKIMSFILLFLVCFCPAFAQVPISTISDAHTIFIYHQPVLSPDAHHIAWEVQEKPENEYFDPNAYFNPLKTDVRLSGMKIYIGGDDFETPIEIAVNGKGCWSPRWSPDGNTLAYYSDADGQCELWLYSLKDKKIKKVPSPPLRAILFTEKPVWSADSKEIYVSMVPTQALESYEDYISRSVSTFHSGDADNVSVNTADFLRNSSDLAAINIESGTSRLIVAADIASWPSSYTRSPTGRWLSYVSAQWVKDTSAKVHGSLFDIGVVSANGKSRHLLTLSSALDCRFQEITHAWHPFQDRLYFIADNKLWVAVFSEDSLISCQAIYSDLGNFDPATLSFTKDGKNLIVGLDPFDFHDYNQPHATTLALIPLDNRSAPKILTLPEEHAFTGLIQNQDRIAWQPDLNVIAFKAISTRNYKQSIMQIDLNSGQSHLLWEGNGHFSPIDFNKHHDRLFGLYEDFNTPEEIYAFDGQMNRLKRISYTEPAFAQIDVGSVEFFETTVPGANGQTEKVRTAVILPPGTHKGDCLPAIVVHYPGADRTGLISEFGGGDTIGGLPNWLLSNHHFAVLLPNLVMGENGVGRPLQAMTDRLLPQIYQAANLGYIDINRLGIMGNSYGGYGTAGIISHTDLFCAAVAVSGIYDLASFSHHLSPEGLNLWMTWAELYQGNMGKPLFEDPSRYIENSPFYRADKIHTPLLLIHGLLDDAYPDATKMFSALKRLDRPVELVAYKHGHHTINDMQRKDHLDAATHILDFFHRHLD
jgi:dipeptidyl aminopeptidase/acylaminoacyl peptidase